MPAFVPWHTFYRDFAGEYEQGQHITLVGQNGSGKTVLARQLILLRAFILVLATKIRDDSLYKPLHAEGFEIVEAFKPDPEKQPRVILKPELKDVSVSARQAQSEAFEDALMEVWNYGNYCVFADEVRYLTDTLKLSNAFETLWLQGRSLGVSLVAGTQRPYSIPQEAFSQAVHFFFFRESERRNLERMSEFTGGDGELVKYVLPRLPRHEALYIDTRTGLMARTKVIL